MEKYKFQAKSEKGLLEKALEELKVKEEDVITKLYEEKGGLFSGKKYTLEVIKISDIAQLGKELLKDCIQKDRLTIKLTGLKSCNYLTDFAPAFSCMRSTHALKPFFLTTWVSVLP